MNHEKLQETLSLHKLWIIGNPKGKRANLSEADLSGANLSVANFYRAKYQDLGEVVALIPFITDCLKIYGWEPTCRRLAPKFPQQDKRAIMLPSTDFSGAFCFVPGRMEIWWWAGYCPNPETVTVLWKGYTEDDAREMFGDVVETGDSHVYGD